MTTALTRVPTARNGLVATLALILLAILILP